MFESVSVISNVILILGQISDIKFYGILLAFVNKFWTAFPYSNTENWNNNGMKTNKEDI